MNDQPDVAPRPARKKRMDWLDVGIRMLASDGRTGLTVEHMTAAMSVTKGSFYHHFKGAADFEAQLAAHWAESFAAPIEALPDGPVPLGLLDRIVAEAFGQSVEPELEMRTWAQQDERIKPFLERVDGVRRAFVERVFLSATGDPERASLLADTLFAMLIGSVVVNPPIPPERVQELYRAFKQREGLGTGPTPKGLEAVSVFDGRGLK